MEKKDQRDGYLVGKAAPYQKFCRFMKKTLQFIILVSFFSFLYSYFSAFPFFFFFSSYNLQFSTLIFSLFAHSLDRKYVFLICNGILAFLFKISIFNSSGLNTSRVMKSDEGGVDQITELSLILKDETVEENVAFMEYDISPPDTTVAEEQTKQRLEQDYGDISRGAKEMKTEVVILEREEREEEEEDYDDDGEFKENKAVEGTSPVEEVNDASVSTEELNHKFEEFIRKVKEEIRTEAKPTAHYSVKSSIGNKSFFLDINKT